jgi:tetratricopeptide (TPR) repeat protein
MQYRKIVAGETVIEFHNNWLGQETVIANGREVSKKSSVWGTSHHFSVMEDGHPTRYTLISKLTELGGVQLDLLRNGEVIQESLAVNWGSKPAKTRNKAKRQGLSKLNEYALEEALVHFEEALRTDPGDAEVYFHMACAYSVMERAEDGYEALRKAVQYGLQETEEILTHDMLAYLRMREAFENFVVSGFTEFDKEQLS